MTARFPQTEKPACCGNDRSWTPGEGGTTIRLDIAPDAPSGPAEIRLRATSGGIMHEAVWQIVVAAYNPPVEQPPAGGLDLTRWEAQMRDPGLRICGNVISGGTWEGNAWFYDGVKGFLNILRYTGDEQYRQCVEDTREVYLGLVEGPADPDGSLPKIGQVTPWRRFTRGLRMHFEDAATSDAAKARDKAAIIALATRGAFSDLRSGVHVKVSREIASYSKRKPMRWRSIRPLPLYPSIATAL